MSNAVIDGSSSTPQLSVETSYRGISNYHNNQTFVTKSAMNELGQHLSFTQMRFHCSKQQGRTFHVVTVANSTGEAVVQYFSGETDIPPASCGSFVRMKTDNSSSVGVCSQWWWTGKWGHTLDESRLYNHAVHVPHLYHWLLISGDSRWDCDDFDNGVSTDEFLITDDFFVC